MNKTGELIFLHIWIVLLVIICVGYIRGNYAEKSYDARMKWHKWLMPGKWADKEYFIKKTKQAAYFGLPFGILVYFLAMFSILNK